MKALQQNSPIITCKFFLKDTFGNCCFDILVFNITGWNTVMNIAFNALFFITVDPEKKTDAVRNCSYACMS